MVRPAMVRPAMVAPADAGTGEDPALVWTHNAYYPSPAMHDDVAAAVAPALERLVP